MHASSVMDKHIITIDAYADVEDILSSVGEPGPTMLFVVENDFLVGVITKADLLHLVKSKKPIEEIMNQKIVTISPDDRIIHARRQMIDEEIARLPVVNNGILIGMISDIDIAFALEKIKKSFPLGRQKHQLEELLVNDAMTAPAISIESNKTVVDAAEIMREHHVGCLPVIKNKKIIGIISRTDLLKTIEFK